MGHGTLKPHFFFLSYLTEYGCRSESSVRGFFPTSLPTARTGACEGSALPSSFLCFSSSSVRYSVLRTSVLSQQEVVSPKNDWSQLRHLDQSWSLVQDRHQVITRRLVDIPLWLLESTLELYFIISQRIACFANPSLSPRPSLSFSLASRLRIRLSAARGGGFIPSGKRGPCEATASHPRFSDFRPKRSLSS